MISHKANLERLCGDIGNLFPNAYTNKKVYIPKSGIYFALYAGKFIVISKPLYGLCSSSERFQVYLSDTLPSFGFLHIRFNNDVYIGLDKSLNHYKYICTHVDDFMVFSVNVDQDMREIVSIYLVKDSFKG